MVTESDSELPGIRELWERLRRMEDVEAVRQLHYVYCRVMDEGFDADALGALWIEEGVWDGGPFGQKKGRKAIVEFFREHGREVHFAAHYLANEEVVVTGDRAVCRCIGLVPATMTIGGVTSDEWMSVTWRNTMVKRNGKWFFDTLQATVNRSVSGPPPASAQRSPS